MIVTEAAVTIPQIKQPTYSSSSSSRSHGSAITTEREAPAAGASYTCEKNVPWIKNNHVITHINVLVASLKLLFYLFSCRALGQNMLFCVQSNKASEKFKTNKILKKFILTDECLFNAH